MSKKKKAESVKSLDWKKEDGGEEAKEEFDVVAFELSFLALFKTEESRFPSIDLPNEMIRKILSYLNFDFDLITSVGLVNRTLYLAILKNWNGTVVLSKDSNANMISLHALKSAKSKSITIEKGLESTDYDPFFILFKHIEILELLKEIRFKDIGHSEINQFIEYFKGKNDINILLPKLELVIFEESTSKNLYDYNRKITFMENKCKYAIDNPPFIFVDFSPTKIESIILREPLVYHSPTSSLSSILSAPPIDSPEIIEFCKNHKIKDLKLIFSDFFSFSDMISYAPISKTVTKLVIESPRNIEMDDYKILSFILNYFTKLVVLKILHEKTKDYGEIIPNIQTITEHSFTKLKDVTLRNVSFGVCVKIFEFSPEVEYLKVFYDSEIKESPKNVDFENFLMNTSEVKYFRVSLKGHNIQFYIDREAKKLFLEFFDIHYRDGEKHFFLCFKNLVLFHQSNCGRENIYKCFEIHTESNYIRCEIEFNEKFKEDKIVLV